MTADEAVVAIVQALESLAIPYMVSGALATNVYGVPRATDDGDFVLELPPGGRIADIAGALPAAMRLEPQTRFETVTASRMHVCTVADSAFRLELFLLTDDPYDRERFARRYRLALPFGTVWMPTVEDVIVTKLLWAARAGRLKDRDDCRGVIALQEKLIDWEYVRRWCDRHGTRDLLDEIRRSIPADLDDVDP
jgi:hypothetical protein